MTSLKTHTYLVYTVTRTPAIKPRASQVDGIQGLSSVNRQDQSHRKKTIAIETASKWTEAYSRVSRWTCDDEIGDCCWLRSCGCRSTSHCDGGGLFNRPTTIGTFAHRQIRCRLGLLRRENDRSGVY